MDNNIEPIIEIPDNAGEPIRNIQNNRLPEQNNSIQKSNNKKNHTKLFVIIGSVVVMLISLFLILKFRKDGKLPKDVLTYYVSTQEEFLKALENGKDFAINSDLIVAFSGTKIDDDINIDLNGYRLNLNDYFYANGKVLHIIDNKGTGKLDITNLYFINNDKYDESRIIPVLDAKIVVDSVIYDSKTFEDYKDGKLVSMQFTDDGFNMTYKYLNKEYESKKLNEDVYNYFLGDGKGISFVINRPVEVVLTDYTVKNSYKLNIEDDGKLTIIGNFTFENGVIIINADFPEQIDLSGLTISGLSEEHKKEIIMISGIDTEGMLIPNDCSVIGDFIVYNK